MKARNAKERAVEEATRLYIHDETQEETVAIQEAARPKFYVRLPLNRKDRGVWCTHCGATLVYDQDLLVNKLEELFEGKGPAKITCPHCGQTLWRCRFIENGVGHKVYRDYTYTMKAEVHGDWQVLRYYYVDYECRLGKPSEMGRPIEVVRRWYNVRHGGRQVVWSVGRLGCCIYSSRCDLNLNAPISLKDEDRGRVGMGAYYGTVSYRIDIDGDAIVSGSQWHPLLKRDGLHGIGTLNLLHIEAYDAPLVFKTPPLITLYKARRYKLASYYAGSRDNDFAKIRADWPSIKVALRHGYDISDPGLWHDHLEMLRELGEDTLSPHWICPDNLRLAHDQANTRVLRLRRQKKAEEDRKKEAAEEEKYARHIAAFRDLRISGKGVVIAVIPSVEAVRQEGEHMNHCVFSMAYYNKPTSLLLSARDEGGNRLETVEFSLATGEVLQSRAVCNGTSPKHKQILAMMKAASDQITDAWKRAKAERPKVEVKPVQELVRAFV